MLLQNIAGTCCFAIAFRLFDVENNKFITNKIIIRGGCYEENKLNLTPKKLSKDVAIVI